ncbi:hypothetical protein FORC88_4260 [Salmonella enterica subsp. enterica serovar Typhimurium]|nr:hypothetical protein FORC88_4260 [Salmonella enterica subsp. enterica serovar Typhimurium]
MYCNNPDCLKYEREISSAKYIIYSHFLTTKRYYKITLENGRYYQWLIKCLL